MALFDDLINNRDVRAAWSYGLHGVRGPQVKHVEEFVSTDKRTTWRFDLGVGEWHSCERMSYDGYLLTAGTDYFFHAGGKTDTADAFFPDDDPIPGYAYNSVRPPDGYGADGDPNKIYGVYKCLKLAQYDSSGLLTQGDGTAIPDGADPRDYYTWSASPARVIADAMKRAGAVRWVRAVPDHTTNSFTATAHGLSNYEQVRVITGMSYPAGLLAGLDYYVINAGANTFQLSATFGGSAADFTDNGSGFVYVGSLKPRLHWSDWRYKHDWDAFLIDWDADGAGPEAAVQIPRFEAHLFFVPPFRLSQLIDRVCEVSCAEWQRANGRIRLFTPEARASVFTFDETKVGAGTFKTRPTDRRSKPNRVRVDFRDHDTDDLIQAGDEGACEPVVITRGNLVAAAGGVVTEYQIDGGVMRRSQAERLGHYTARSICDSDQEVEIDGAPDAYLALPADVAGFTHSVPNWSNNQFKLMVKEEDDFTRLGYRIFGRLYAPGAYSDTDQTPAPRALPAERFNPYVAPEHVTGLALDEEGDFTTDGGWQPKLLVNFFFGEHPLQQYAKVEYHNGDGQWRLAGLFEKPAGSAEVMVAISGVEKKTYTVRVTARTQLASAGVGTAPSATWTIQAVAPAIAPINDNYFFDAHDTLFVTWDPGVRPAGVLAQGEEVKKYKVTCRKTSFVGAVLRGPVPVDTLPNFASSWIHFSLVSFPCSSPPTTDKDGTAAHVGSGTDVGCVVMSQSITGDCDIYFEVGAKFPPRRIDIINYPSMTTTEVYWETTEAGGVPTLHAGNTGVSMQAIPGRYGIRISRRQAEFLGPAGQVLGRSSDVPLLGVYRIQLTFGLLAGEAQEAKRVTIAPTEPEFFVYTAEQMVADDPTFTPGVDTVYVEVVTVSNNPSAADSAPLEITCTP